MSQERFEIQQEKLRFGTEALIVTDKETGVQYLYFRYGNGGGLTPLLDSEGRPIIKK